PSPAPSGGRWRCGSNSTRRPPSTRATSRAPPCAPWRKPSSLSPSSLCAWPGGSAYATTPGVSSAAPSSRSRRRGSTRATPSRRPNRATTGAPSSASSPTTEARPSSASSRRTASPMASPSPKTEPRIVALTPGLERRGLSLGGKAEGLLALMERGARVPPAFAIVDATADWLPADLGAHYRALGGGRVAVRSSAVGEDGERSSFAGQFESVLDVEGLEALEAAVARCLSSASLERVEAY